MWPETFQFKTPGRSSQTSLFIESQVLQFSLVFRYKYARSYETEYSDKVTSELDCLVPEDSF